MSMRFAEGLPKITPADLPQAAQGLQRCPVAHVAPVIIIGGIWTGKSTPTESAAIASVYAIILGLMVYRELDGEGLWRLLVESAGMTANAIIIVAGASLSGYILAREQAAPKLAAIILGVARIVTGSLLMINLFLLFVGTFMEPVSAMIIPHPRFYFLIIKMINVHPVHFWRDDDF